MTLTLGRTKEGISIGLDIEQLLRSRLLVQASSGGGKSSLMRLIAEHTGNTQFFVLDPEGEFFTLREEVKGLLIVGQRGDLQADPKTAKVLARRLLEIGASAVIDLSDLQLPQRRQYVRFFIESLMSAPQSLQHDLLVFIDEAHMFVPERSAGEAESTAAVIDLMSRGRKRKFAGILATQRLSKLHKDAAAECANVLIGRTTLDVDQKRAIDMLGMTSQDRRVLRDLAVGEFFGFGPALDHPGVVSVRALMPRTKEPERGANSTRVAPASSQVQRMITELTDLAKKDEDKPVTIEDAEATISKLRRELAAKPKVAPVEKPVVDQKSIDRAVAVRDKLWQAELSKAKSVFDKAMRNLTDSRNRINDVLGFEWPKTAEVVMNATANVTNPSKSVTNVAQNARNVTAPRVTLNPSAGIGERLPIGEQKTLIACAQYPDGLRREQLTILTQYKRSSRDAYIQRLKEKGYLEQRGELVSATQAGVDALGDAFEPLPTGVALRNYWLGILPQGEKSVLSVLLAAYPEAVHRDRISEATGYQRSSRDAYIQRMKAKMLIDDVGRGEIRASDNLFD